MGFRLTLCLASLFSAQVFADLSDEYQYDRDESFDKAWLNHGYGVGAISKVGKDRSNSVLIQIEAEQTAYLLDFKIGFSDDGKYVDVEFDTIELDLLWENADNNTATIRIGFEGNAEYQRDEAIGMNDFVSFRALRLAGGLYHEMNNPDYVFALEAALSFLGYAHAEHQSGADAGGWADGTDILAGVLGKKLRVVFGAKFRTIRDSLFDSDSLASRDELFARVGYRITKNWEVVVEASEQKFDFTGAEEDSVSRLGGFIKYSPFAEGDDDSRSEFVRSPYGTGGGSQWDLLRSNALR